MPNLAMLALAVLIALAITLSSAKKDEQKTRETVEKMNPKPDGAMVQGDASGGAWLVGFIVVVVLVYAAMPR